MLCQRGGQICKPSRLCCFPRLRIAALLFACSPCHVGSLVPAAIQMPSNGSAETPPALSVILPVYNAMPWLPLAVRDILKQDLHGAPLELICANDSSSDGSLAFLDELVALLGPRASREECLLSTDDAHSHLAKRQRVDDDGISAGAASGPSTNPALRQALRAAETEDHPSFEQAEEPEELKNLRTNPVTAEDVAGASRTEHRLLVLSWGDGVNRGQGAAMTACLARARAPLIAQMESDDERPSPDALRKMVDALGANPEWDGVSCQTALIGWPRPGMERYVAWQNSLVPCPHASTEPVRAIHRACRSWHLPSRGELNVLVLRGGS